MASVVFPASVGTPAISRQSSPVRMDGPARQFSPVQGHQSLSRVMSPSVSTAVMTAAPVIQLVLLTNGVAEANSHLEQTLQEARNAHVALFGRSRCSRLPPAPLQEEAGAAHGGQAPSQLPRTPRQAPRSAFASYQGSPANNIVTSMRSESVPAMPATINTLLCPTTAPVALLAPSLLDVQSERMQIENVRLQEELRLTREQQQALNEEFRRAKKQRQLVDEEERQQLLSEIANWRTSSSEMRLACEAEQITVRQLQEELSRTIEKSSRQSSELSVLEQKNMRMIEELLQAKQNHKSDVDLLEQEVRALRGESEALQKERRNLLSDLTSSKVLVSELQQSNSSQKTIFLENEERLQEELASFKDQMAAAKLNSHRHDDLQMRHSSLLEEHDQLQRRLSSHLEEHDQLQRRHSSHLEEHDQLQRRHSSHLEENDQFQKDFLHLKQTRDERDQAIARHRRESGELRKQLSTVSEECDRHKSNHVQTREERDQAIARHRRENDELRKRLSTISEECDRHKSDHVQTRDELDQAIVGLRRENDELREELNIVSEECDRSKSDIVHLRNSLDERDTTIESLRRSMEQEQIKLRSLSQENAINQAEIARLKVQSEWSSTNSYGSTGEGLSSRSSGLNTVSSGGSFGSKLFSTDNGLHYSASAQLNSIIKERHSSAESEELIFTINNKIGAENASLEEVFTVDITDDIDDEDCDSA